MLNSIPLFSMLSSAELNEIEQYSCVRTYPKNTIIINENDEINSLYFIMSGKVKLYMSDCLGKEVVLNYLKDGDYLGELALIGESTKMPSVMTMNQCTLLLISKNAFDIMLEGVPDIAVNLIRELSGRVYSLTENIKSLALLDVYGRVTKTLLSLAIPHDGKLIIEEKLTKQDLANRIGASREMVSKILKDLDTGGYISFHKRQIVINSQLPSQY